MKGAWLGTFHTAGAQGWWPVSLWSLLGAALTPPPAALEDSEATEVKDTASVSPPSEDTQRKPTVQRQSQKEE